MKRFALFVPFLVLVFVASLSARDITAWDEDQPFGGILTQSERAQLTSVNMTIGRMWNHVNNYGGWGGECGSGMLGYTWPGGAAVNNYYLWNSYFWVGASVNGQAYVTAHDYPIGNWSPSVVDSVIYAGPGKSPFDVVVYYDDYKDNPRNPASRHLGLQVVVRAMMWPHAPYYDLVAYEVYITYDSSQCDIDGHGEYLDSVYVGIVFDADVSGADESEPHIDDLVSYDGWTNGEWDPSHPVGWSLIKDSVALLPDSTINEPDGLEDYYVIWGDEPEEHIDSADAWEITLTRGGRDTTFLGYVFPRNMSYIYDGDNPKVGGDDTGEDGKCAGYIGGAWIYTPESGSDSIVGNVRFIHPAAHQWWNWESDPASDDDRYAYMKGTHPSTAPYRFALHPLDFGADPFDYRFLNTVGPFRFQHGVTYKFVFIGGVGQGLNGGPDTYWGMGNWVHGLRHVIDWGIKAYYTCDTTVANWRELCGDPIHPAPPEFDPSQDVHWNIPIPPASPQLVYNATPEGVQLVWDDTPERTPDPRRGFVDFQGYIIYRAQFVPQNWEVLDTILPNPTTGKIAHSYVDSSDVIPGMPYYYAVTAFDDEGLESGKVNYKRDANGSPVPVIIPSKVQTTLDEVYVVPNPYYGSAVWTATELADKVEFHNLPPSAVIKIYTFSGDLVRVIEHNDGTGSASWNLLNDEGQKVANGVYFYKVETVDDNGEYHYKVGKFVILK